MSERNETASDTFVSDAAAIPIPILSPNIPACGGSEPTQIVAPTRGRIDGFVFSDRYDQFGLVSACVEGRSIFPGASRLPIMLDCFDPRCSRRLVTRIVEKGAVIELVFQNEGVVYGPVRGTAWFVPEVMR